MTTSIDATHGPALKRSLGLGLLTFYGVGVMIGAGIYVLIGEVAAVAGGWTPLAFALAGAATALTAASFAELSARIPEAGGSATYARAAFRSATAAAVVGLSVCAAGLLSAATVLQGGVGYLQALLAAPTALLILVVGAFLTGLAVWGAVQSLAFAAILTIIEIIGLLIVVAVAFWAEPVATPSAASSGAAPATATLAALPAAVFLAFFAFIGFEDVVNMAEETRDPARTIPYAILLAFLIVIAIYVAVAAAALHVVSPAALADSPRPLALVYERATGGDAGFIAAIGVAAALNGVLAQLMMSARILLSLGRRSEALGWLGVTDPRFRTPLRATVLVGGLTVALALTVDLGGLAAATSLVLLAVFVLMNVALILLKRAGPPPPGALNLPIWLPALGALVSLGVLLGAAL